MRRLILVRQYSRLSGRASWRFMRVAPFAENEEEIRAIWSIECGRPIPRRLVKWRQRAELRAR